MREHRTPPTSKGHGSGYTTQQSGICVCVLVAVVSVVLEESGWAVSFGTCVSTCPCIC